MDIKFSIVILLLLFLSFQVFFLHRNVKFFLFSSIYLHVYFLIFSVLSANFYYFFINNKVNLCNFDYLSTRNDVINSDIYFLTYLNLFLTTIHFLYLLSNKNYRVLLRFKNTHNSSNVFIFREKRGSKKIFTYTILSIILLLINITLLYLVYDKGLFIRYEYLPQFSIEKKLFKILLKIESIFLVLTLGINFRYCPLISIILFASFIFFNISTGSRIVIVSLFLYLIVILGNLKTKLSFKAKLYISLYILFSIVFSSYLIQLRAIDSHGLIPYISYFTNFFSNVIYELYFLLYYIFIYGFFVTIQVMYEHTVNWQTLLISVNPLPGTIAGWYEINEALRINPFVPYNLFGEIFSLGLTTLIAYSIIISTYFFWIEKLIKKKFFLENKKLFGITLYLLTLVFSIYSWEYNLRSSLRLVYYSIIFYFIFAMFDFLLKILKYKRK